jgi:7,8-dihydroneopterin aldolase/epimerase/oxygenase
MAPGNRSRKAPSLPDLLQLQVHDLEVEVLTGVYSEETHLPQPLRISLDVDLDMPERFEPDTPLSASKSYLDLKHAATTSLPKDVHFTLIEAVAEHVCDTLFISDHRVRRVQVRIVKLAIAEAGESIGITMVRHRR